MKDDENKFIDITSAIGEAARAKMLYSLLVNGKSLTATELACEAGISLSAASNHLTKLVNVNVLKMEKQGRYRYYTFYNKDIAYAIETLGSIVSITGEEKKEKPIGIKYCRTCYDHMAGYVGVQVTKAMEEKGILVKTDKDYLLTEKGMEWLKINFNIVEQELQNKKRYFARQCIDWTERQPHLSGHLGAMILSKMIDFQWVKKIQFTRELLLTTIGKQAISKLLDIPI